MQILMKFMNRFLPSCKEVSHLTSQAMDEVLPWRKRIGLRLHLRMCIWCQRNAEQLQMMRNIAHEQTATLNKQNKLSPDARERIAKLLKQNEDQS